MSEGQIVPTAFGLVWVRFWFRFLGFTPVYCEIVQDTPLFSDSDSA